MREDRRADGQMDRHDDVNNRFSSFMEAPKNGYLNPT